MKFDYVLLGLLARQPRSGYELRKWLVSDGQYIRSNADQSQIYRTLVRLSDRGYVEFSVDERENSPTAKVYSLTDKGAATLMEWLDSDYVPTSRFQDADFLARYTCGGILKPASLIPMIDREIAYRETQIRKFRNRNRLVVVGSGPIPIDRDFAQELLDDAHLQGVNAADNWLAWLRAQRAKLIERFG